MFTCRAFYLSLPGFTHNIMSCFSAYHKRKLLLCSYLKRETLYQLNYIIKVLFCLDATKGFILPDLEKKQDMRVCLLRLSRYSVFETEAISENCFSGQPQSHQILKPIR
jgi:hypothetical protein